MRLIKLAVVTFKRCHCYKLLVYAADNLLDENKDIIKKTTEDLLVDNTEVYLQVDTEKTKYIYTYLCHQTTGQSNI